jgi:hypothetical protein
VEYYVKSQKFLARPAVETAGSHYEVRLRLRLIHKSEARPSHAPSLRPRLKTGLERLHSLNAHEGLCYGNRTRAVPERI